MKHAIVHDLDASTAKKATLRAFAEYSARYPEYAPELRWLDERRANVSFSPKGIKIGGTLTVGERSVDLDLDVPFLLRIFQKKAVDIIDREVRIWIGKAKDGLL